METFERVKNQIDGYVDISTKWNLESQKYFKLNLIFYMFCVLLKILNFNIDCSAFLVA